MYIFFGYYYLFIHYLKVIANQPKLETVEIHVRAIFIGRIIGKNGETIHSIQDRSRCKIKIESRQTDDGNYLTLNWGHDYSLYL